MVSDIDTVVGGVHLTSLAQASSPARLVKGALEWNNDNGNGDTEIALQLGNLGKGFLQEDFALVWIELIRLDLLFLR